MKNVTGIILAGGKSTRMGTDKGLVDIDNKPMISQVIEQFEALKIPIIIIGDNSKYGQFGYPTFEDIYKDKGPIGGIHSGLTNSSTETNIILSCDVPMVNASLIKHLYSKSEKNQITIPIYNSRTHPLIGIYKKSVLKEVKSCIDNDELRLTILCDKCNCNLVELSDLHEFNVESLLSNINTIDELEQLKRQMTKVQYFGMIAEQTKTSNENVILNLERGPLNLRLYFESRYPELKNMSYIIAVDQSITNEEVITTTPFEISLLPPFAGG